MSKATTLLDLIAVLMVATAIVITGAELLGWYGTALGLVAGSMFVAGSSAAASKRGGDPA